MFKDVTGPTAWAEACGNGDPLSSEGRWLADSCSSALRYVSSPSKPVGAILSLMLVSTNTVEDGGLFVPDAPDSSSGMPRGSGAWLAFISRRSVAQRGKECNDGRGEGTAEIA